MPWPTNRYSHMVQEYYVARLREAAAKRTAAIERLRSRGDVLALQRDVRGKLRRIFSPVPKKTPLCARVTGRIETRQFVIEKLLLESRPGFLVSADLYLPRRLDRPAPCVLAPCGHSLEGKAADVYQSFVQGLARKGFVGLIYDPISQGERVQYPNKDGQCSLGLCGEHNMIGRQQALVGEWFGMWRAWDGVRCLDYLLGRPEVDPTRVGVTGNSGGGTLTAWLVAADDRFTMAAPGCWVTTLLSNLENELPADIEQIPPAAVAMGLDEADVFIPFAPRPLILLTQRQDFFDQRGSQQVFRQLRHIYRLLGAEQNVQIFTGPTRHGYSIHNRQAMYAFFAKHAGVAASGKEPRILVHSPQELAATPKLSTRRAGSKRVFDFTRDAAAALAAKRKPVPAARLRRMLADMLAIPPRGGVPHHRVLRHHGDGTIVFQGYAVETEPGIQAIVTMLCPDGNQFALPPEKRCSLLVPHVAAFDDLNDRRLRGLLMSAGARAMAVDPRGIGQSMPQGCDGGNFFASYDFDYFFDSHGLMLGEPYLGRRVFDVLRTVDWLAGHGYRRIELLGRGLGAVTALLAAMLEPRLVHVTLVNALLSYQELTEVPIHRWPQSAQLRGALAKFDLPDCLRALAGRLTLIEPWDAQMRRLAPAAAAKRVRAIGLPARCLKKGRVR